MKQKSQKTVEEIESVLLEAIQDALKLAKYQTEKNRSIDNINADSVCFKFKPRIEAILNGNVLSITN